MERRWIRILLWIAVIAVCAMIWGFSAQDGEASGAASASVLRWAIALLVNGFDSLALAEQRSLYETAEWLLRKGAHFAEFALLAFLVRLLLRSYRVRRGGWFWAWFAASLYAVTDELHQFFMAARDASLTDVCIDSAGAAFGAGLACLILWAAARGRAAKQPPEAR